ncbi:uncharacterized protein BDR25DRAFT_244686, partial [Lindgomyces ingoldianus]
FYLSRNALAYLKIIKKICTTFASLAEIVNSLKLALCLYLHACINKSLRLTPPRPSKLS